MHEQLNEILRKSKEESAGAKGVKVHQFECFQPKEIFNINTHAMFKRDRVKDPLDSDDRSNDDEEDIEKLLMGENNEKLFQDPHKTARSLGKQKSVGNAKIDLEAYKPGMPIDYNIKVLRSMFLQVK